MKRIDLIGQKFGRLTVIEFAHTKNKKTYWKCKCDCGNECNVQSYELRIGHTKSCGCYQQECRGKSTLIHRDTGTKFYNTWNRMKGRCLNKNNHKYKNYGNRGITVCNKWLNYIGFKEDMYDSFIEHFNKYGSKNTTLDRIDVNGNYCKKNCRWATNKEQANNKTKHNFITYKNKTQNLSQWADEFNISYGKLYQRINTYNWSIERALNK